MDFFFWFFASDSLLALPNSPEESTPEVRAQTIAQQQCYTTEDLYKPRFDFGNRNRRRGQNTEESVKSESVEPSQ